MKSTDVIRKVLKYAGINAHDASRKIGKHEHYLTSMLHRGSSQRADTLAKVLDVCGYKLMCVPDDVAYELDNRRCFVIDDNDSFVCQKCGKQIEGTGGTTIGIGGKSADLCDDCARELIESIAVSSTTEQD